MSTTIYVLDTSYLIEIADCDGFSQPKAVAEVRKRLKNAAAKGARFFVPLPCLFELGNHIADVKHAVRRHELAQWLLSSVKNSLTKRTPWHITPTGNPESILPSLMDQFVPLAAKRSVGLVDTFTIAEAKRLKASHERTKLKVHIWTNDSDLKEHEPDKEVGAFLWKSDGTPR